MGFSDPKGQDLIVGFYGSLVVGHAGIGVNSLQTYGFYANINEVSKIELASEAKNAHGNVLNDFLEKGVPRNFIIIPTSKETDRKAIRLIQDYKNNKSNKYNLYNNDCVNFVENILKNAGIDADTTSNIPLMLYLNLKLSMDLFTRET